MCMNKVIVTGGYGYLARNMIKKLLAENVEIVAIVRGRRKDEELQGVKYILAEEQNELCQTSYDAMYHFAWEGSAGVKRADCSIQLKNVENTINMALLSKQCGCKKFIAIGTVSENLSEGILSSHYLSDNVVYGLTKRYTHQLLDVVCHREGIHYVWVRLAGVYGLDDCTNNIISYSINTIKRGEIPTYGPCRQLFNFTHIEDVINALYILGEKENRKSEYIVNGNETWLLKQYIQAIGDVYGVKMGIGLREDDGIKYEREWFNNSDFVEEYGFSFIHDFISDLQR